MSWQCSIRLTSERGSPLGNYQILILFSGLIGSSHTEYTDGDGWAYFENEYEDGSRSVDSISTYTGVVNSHEVTLARDTSIEDGETMAFTVSDDEF
ncbi:hypothetical protein X766_03995 [Mesorhizobium sp. LSJC255A00]|nr:hypothetical protein X766_03995 [Mesorhizobium sp. LSJC255A00]